MIVFQKLGWHGRLGNCMFQFAAMKSLAKHLNIKAKIPIDLKYRVWDNQQCLLPYFKLNCESYEEDEIKHFHLFNEYNTMSGRKSSLYIRDFEMFTKHKFIWLF